jgi:hypothetical protein
VWLLVSSDALVVFNGNHGDRSVAGTFSLDGKLITVSGGDGSRSSLGSAPFVTVETTLAFLKKLLRDRAAHAAGQPSRQINARPVILPWNRFTGIVTETGRE